MSRWASSPSLVSSSRPSVSASRRPTWNSRTRSGRRHVVAEAGPALRVVHRGDHAERLVEGEVARSLGAVAMRMPSTVDDGGVRVDAHALLADHVRPSTSTRPGGDRALAGAAAADAGRGQHLLQPARGFAPVVILTWRPPEAVVIRWTVSSRRRRRSSGLGQERRERRELVEAADPAAPGSTGGPVEDRAGSGSVPASSTSPRVSSVRITPSTFTPRIAETRPRLTGWRYATTARVSSAAWVSRACWPSRTNFSTTGAYSARRVEAPAAGRPRAGRSRGRCSS